MKSSSFFDNRKKWSQRKHRLLTKYLPPFGAKVATTSTNRLVFIVDGFAGAAVYEDGSEGSPILTARFSDACSGWNSPVTLRLFNVECDKDDEGIFESLERVTEEWTKKGVVTNIRNDFRMALPQILNELGGSPALFFIDPFGPTDLFFDDIKPILERIGITELIINFDHDGLRRIVDAALSRNTQPKAAETNARNISKIIGTDTWKDKIDGKGLTSTQSETILITEYMQQIASYDFNVVAYPIREELKATPKYQLIYCTRHRDGMALMNDFMREEEDSLYDDHVGEHLTLFADEASLVNAVQERRQKLESIVKDYLRGRTSVRRSRLRKSLIIENFGQFHTKDYNAIVKQMLEVGTLREKSGKFRINDHDELFVN